MHDSFMVFADSWKPFDFAQGLEDLERLTADCYKRESGNLVSG